LLSDAGGKVGTAFGVFDDGAGVETRGRFIIDPDGVVQGFEVLTPPVFCSARGFSMCTVWRVA
jgi:peroxiredoxin (alkyl hydroperoxide reductase subunit C)